MKQKEIFLRTEGDAWYERNREVLSRQWSAESDPVLLEILDFYPPGVREAPLRVLEIGCGEGRRLSWLHEHLGADCHGIEPSAQAVSVACQRGLQVVRGAADDLPFGDQSFDVVIFGFCLYLCDREDLFRIASEADRVLAAPGWLVIQDFFQSQPLANPYHHRDGVLSYKMDYRTLFIWHPAYECLTHKVRAHGAAAYSDDGHEWVGVSVLRKLAGSTTK